jgi:hypothetical protein
MSVDELSWHLRLADGILSNQNPNLGKFVENVGIIMAIW